MISRLLRPLLAGVALAWLGGAASADETTLIFATLTPTDGHQNTDIFHPWADHINEVGKGVVNIDVRDGFAIASRNNFYTRILDDVVQIAWGPQAAIGGQFPRSDVVGIPFIADTALASSVAFWRLYQSGLLDAEYKDVIPLWVVGEAQSALHMTRPVRTLDNLEGAKILVATNINSDTVAHLGGTPLSLPLEDAYTSLQRRAVDGMFFPWTGVQTFKLDDVTSYHIDAPLGGAAGMVFMSRKKFESLPPAAQKILRDNSGEAMASRHGASLDQVQAEVRQATKADPKQQVVTLSPNEEAAWRQRLASVADAWAKSTPDGDRVLATYRDLVAQVKAGPATP